jgi:hypothetical protein
MSADGDVRTLAEFLILQEEVRAAAEARLTASYRGDAKIHYERSLAAYMEFLPRVRAILCRGREVK